MYTHKKPIIRTFGSQYNISPTRFYFILAVSRMPADYRVDNIKFIIVYNIMFKYFIWGRGVH